MEKLLSEKPLSEKPPDEKLPNIPLPPGDDSIPSRASCQGSAGGITFVASATNVARAANAYAHALDSGQPAKVKWRRRAGEGQDTPYQQFWKGVDTMAILKTRPNISKRTLLLAFAYVTSAIKGEADRELTLESVHRWYMTRQFCDNSNMDDDSSTDQEKVIFDVYEYLYSILNNTFPEKTRPINKRSSSYHRLIDVIGY